MSTISQPKLHDPDTSHMGISFYNLIFRLSFVDVPSQSLSLHVSTFYCLFRRILCPYSQNKLIVSCLTNLFDDDHVVKRMEAAALFNKLDNFFRVALPFLALFFSLFSVSPSIEEELKSPGMDVNRFSNIHLIVSDIC